MPTPLSMPIKLPSGNLNPFNHQYFDALKDAVVGLESVGVIETLGTVKLIVPRSINRELPSSK